jgi:hypothetical protein
MNLRLTPSRRVRELARALGAGLLAVIRDPIGHRGQIVGVLGGLGSLATAFGYAKVGGLLSSPDTQSQVVTALIVFGGALTALAGALQPAPPKPDA